jgi:hypothetical protein
MGMSLVVCIPSDGQEMWLGFTCGTTLSSKSLPLVYLQTHANGYTDYLKVASEKLGKQKGSNQILRTQTSTTTHRRCYYVPIVCAHEVIECARVRRRLVHRDVLAPNGHTDRREETTYRTYGFRLNQVAAPSAVALLVQRVGEGDDWRGAHDTRVVPLWSCKRESKKRVKACLFM